MTLPPLKSETWAKNYIKGRLEFWLDITANAITLPEIEEQEERLWALACAATTASPKQRKIVKQQIDRARTNWQRHQWYEAQITEKKARRAINRLNRIKAIETYVTYAQKRGFSRQQMIMTIDQIWDSIE